MNSLALKLPQSAPRRVAVVAAMPEELAPLVAAIPDLKGRNVRLGRTLGGKLGNVEVVLACTGEGSERALRGALDLLRSTPVDLLLGVGTAGGLTDSLETGALLVATELREGDRPGRQPDPVWVERALACPGAVAGTVLTSERILCSAAEKEAARARLAPAGPAVVDLESTAFAEAADRIGVPCLIVRAVCDTASDDLPIDMNLCRDDEGRINRFAVVRQAIFSPGAARELLRLRKRLWAASERLALLVTALLEEDDRGSN